MQIQRRVCKILDSVIGNRIVIEFAAFWLLLEEIHFRCMHFAGQTRKTVGVWVESVMRAYEGGEEAIVLDKDLANVFASLY